MRTRIRLWRLKRGDFEVSLGVARRNMSRAAWSDQNGRGGGCHDNSNMLRETRKSWVGEWVQQGSWTMKNGNQCHRKVKRCSGKASSWLKMNKLVPAEKNGQKRTKRNNWRKGYISTKYELFSTTETFRVLVGGFCASTGTPRVKRDPSDMEYWEPRFEGTWVSFPQKKVLTIPYHWAVICALNGIRIITCGEMRTLAFYTRLRGF